MIMRPPWWRTSIELGNTRLGRVHLHAFAILYADERLTVDKVEVTASDASLTVTGELPVDVGAGMVVSAGVASPPPPPQPFSKQTRPISRILERSFDDIVLAQGGVDEDTHSSRTVWPCLM